MSTGRRAAPRSSGRSDADQCPQAPDQLRPPRRAARPRQAAARGRGCHRPAARKTTSPRSPETGRSTHAARATASQRSRPRLQLPHRRLHRGGGAATMAYPRHRHARRRRLGRRPAPCRHPRPSPPPARTPIDPRLLRRPARPPAPPPPTPAPGQRRRIGQETNVSRQHCCMPDFDTGNDRESEAILIHKRPQKFEARYRDLQALSHGVLRPPRVKISELVSTPWAA